MRIYKSFRSGNRITLFNGDCIDLLKSMPDESVDLVVTSPPYCIGKAYEDPHDDIETFKTLHTNIFNDNSKNMFYGLMIKLNAKFRSNRIL